MIKKNTEKFIPLRNYGLGVYGNSILSFVVMYGNTYASNTFIGKTLGISTSTTSRTIKFLNDKGYIEIYNPHGRSRFIKLLTTQPVQSDKVTQPNQSDKVTQPVQSDKDEIPMAHDIDNLTTETNQPCLSDHNLVSLSTTNHTDKDNLVTETNNKKENNKLIKKVLNKAYKETEEVSEVITNNTLTLKSSTKSVEEITSEGKDECVEQLLNTKINV